MCEKPWLDEAFLQKCLENITCGREIQVNEYDVCSASSAGKNYSSELDRVDVYFTEWINEDGQRQIANKGNCKLIVKSALPDAQGFEQISSMNVYAKEMTMYNKVVPKINALLSEVDVRPIFAKSFHTTEFNSIIVLEDLTESGYVLKDIRDGFNMNEARISLKKLAQFHGCCAKLNEQQSNIFENVKIGIQGSAGLETCYVTFLQAIIERVEQWPEFGKINEKLRALKPKIYSKIKEEFDVHDNRFNTLIHGDAWLNNIMVKYNDKAELENAVLIDLQACCYASPLLDIHHFFGTSLKDELRLDAIVRRQLLNFYHDELVSILKRLNYQKHIPSFNELYAQYMSSNIVGFSASCLMHPVMVAEPHKDACVETFFTDTEIARNFKRYVLESQRNQDNLRILLPFYDSLGVFD